MGRDLQLGPMGYLRLSGKRGSESKVLKKAHPYHAYNLLNKTTNQYKLAFPLFLINLYNALYAPYPYQYTST
jgi:hypothetical protein